MNPTQARQSTSSSKPTAGSFLSYWLAGKTYGDKGDWAAAVLIAICILVFFGKTVFFGLPVSKIARLAEWDSLFSAYWTGSGGNCDPSIVQLTIPYYFIAANFWQSGHLPLWNPYSGFGTPLVGDLQAAVFSPLRAFFFLSPGMHAYNLILVSEVVLAALGTYILARSLAISRYAAILAAFTFALCPYNLYYIENMAGPAFALLPGLFWLFVRLARHPGALQGAAAGAGCAVMILSAHPELSFFNIIFGAMLAIFLLLAGLPEGSNNIGKRLASRAGSLMISATVAFCLSAPVLLPFVEYLLSSDSYKFTIGGSTWVPWQAILYNLLQPGFGAASPYLGAMACIGLPLSLVTAGRRQRTIFCLATLTAVALFITARLGPVNAWFIVRPLNCLITLYCLPVLLLLVTLLIAFGVEELVEHTEIGLNIKFLTAGAGFLAVALFPPSLSAWHVPLWSGDFDMMIPHMAVNLPAWKLQSAFLTAGTIAFIVTRSYRRSPRWLLPLCLLLIGIASQVAAARGALPVQHRFDYPVVAPIPLLQAGNARIVALGNHLCKPSTSAVYGISDITTHNPLFPARYLDFLKACGARVDMFDQVFSSASSRLLDTAAVDYMLTLDLPGTAPGLNARMSHAAAGYDLHLKRLTTTPQGITVYKRTTAMPHACLVHRYIQADSGRQALHLISSSDFDARASAVIETSKTQAMGLDRIMQSASPTAAGKTSCFHYGFPGGAGGCLHDQCTITRDGPNKVVIETRSSRPGLLVLADTYYPGWHAGLDGVAVPILRANFLFRAVAVPAGNHQVEFEYLPFTFVAGICLSFSCLTALAGLLLSSICGLRSHKGKQP